MQLGPVQLLRCFGSAAMKTPSPHLQHISLGPLVSCGQKDSILNNSLLYTKQLHCMSRFSLSFALHISTVHSNVISHKLFLGLLVSLSEHHFRE